MFGRLWRKIKSYIWLVIPLGIAIWLFYVFMNCHLWKDGNCTGFVGKTIWDVLELLIIPISLVGIAAFLERQERIKDRDNVLVIQRNEELQQFINSVKKEVISFGKQVFTNDDFQKNVFQMQTNRLFTDLDLHGKSKLLDFLSTMELVSANSDEDPVLSLENYNFQNITLRYIYFVRSILELSQFQNSNFSGANMSFSRLLGANFSNAILYHTKFEQADMPACTFDKANLVDAIFTDANLGYSSFISANLTDAIFINADLEGANLDKAVIHKTNFYGANLKGVSFRNANISIVNFDKAIMPDGILYDSLIHTNKVLNGFKHKYQKLYY